jgi:hypothetical protein
MHSENRFLGIKENTEEKCAKFPRLQSVLTWNLMPDSTSVNL